MHFDKGCSLLCTVQSLEAYNDCMYILNASSIFKSIEFNMRIISPLFKLVLKMYLIITTLCTFLFQKSLFSVLVREFPAFMLIHTSSLFGEGWPLDNILSNVEVIQNSTPYIRRYGSQLRYRRRGSFPKDT